MRNPQTNCDVSFWAPEGRPSPQQLRQDARRSKAFWNSAV